MPWRIHPPGPPPLVDWVGGAEPAGLDLPDAVLAFLADGRQRARLCEIDGALCATLIAASFEAGDAAPALERVDLVLRTSEVVMRRGPVSGPCPALDAGRIRAQWDQTPAEQRDTSVLFVQIIDAIVDSSGEVLDEVRRRVGSLEERMLAPNPALNRVLSELLDLSQQLGSVRDGLLPLRGDIRELVELRDPVERQLMSAAGARWLRSVELDLMHDVPATLAVAEARLAGAFSQLQGERSEATNRVVLLLTILTVAFFLPTLLTGLYGMNVPLPSQSHRWIFWAFVAIAGTFLAVAGAAITRLGLWGTFWSVVPGGRRGTSATPETRTPPSR